MRSIVSVLAFALVVAPPLCQAEQACSNQQSAQDISADLHDLINKMTIPERIAQLQDRAPALPRLGLPAYNWWNEGLHGLARDGYATVFPQAIGLAASWDPNLLRQVGDVVSTEARAKFNGHGRDHAPRYGGLTVWSPNINIFRDPRWGRGQETYGEDPFLTATLGVAFVKGVQGTDPYYLKADATPKHFAAHSGPERNRDSFNSVVPAHDLADTYLRAFRAVTVDGHASALMCSYNEINGVPSCANDAMLQQTVREQWGFRGYIVSDCDAVGDISAYHHFAKDDAHAAALALNAGTDLDCGNTFAALQASVRQGFVTEATLNNAVYRLLSARMKLGMLDRLGCTPYDDLDAKDIASKRHHDLALQAAEESIVLLHNDGTLPLRSTAHIAAIGPNADLLRVLEANYHGTAVHPVTPLEGLLAANNSVQYAQGSLPAEGVSIPIPRSALQQDRAGKSGPGLKAEYYNQPSLAGIPTVTQTVPTVDFDLDRVGPDPSIVSTQYAARWTGYIQPPSAGEYTLRVHIERCWDCTTHDAFRLYIDDQLVLDDHGAENDSDQVKEHFSDTASHAIRLEYLHTGQDEGVSLEWIPPASALLRQALDTARKSDVVVAFLGLSPDLEGEALQVALPGFDGGDRTSLDLPKLQQDLLNNLLSLHKPVVVILTSGSAVSFPAVSQQPAAILQAWYPGEAGGTAIARVLFGQVNPSGRLPVTFYRSVADLPAFTDYSMEHRTYRYFSGPVLYPFGYGLSYTKFAYSGTALSTDHLHAGEQTVVRTTVHNIGSIPGSTVAELYLTPPQIVGAPRLALAGMQRVMLAPGESREVSFTLTAEQMAIADTTGVRAVHPGSYQIFLGDLQPTSESAASASFQVIGTQILP